MKKISILLTLFIPLFIRAQDRFTLQGDLGMHTSGKIRFYWYNIITGNHVDSADIINGHFTLSGITKDKTQPGQLIFKTDNGEKSIIFYLEPGTIHINYAADAEYPTLSGTPINNDLQQYNKMLYVFLDSVNALRPGQTPYTWYSKEIMSGKIGVIQKFVERHPGSQVSVDQLNQYAIGNKTPDLLEPLFAKLSPALQGSPAGILLASRIRGMRSADIGDNAPNFTLSDTSGRDISLADFKGKYVLIDFWATWCGPCMAEMPNVVKAYSQYKNKGFEIIGVSLDRPDSKAKWLEVIKRDHLDWVHVSDLKWWNSKAALAYYVNAVPANFLVDPQGRIIAKNLRGEDLQKKLVEIFPSPQPNRFVLDGKLLSDSIIGGYIYINYHNKGNLVPDRRDSALIVDNKYHFEGTMTDGAVRVVVNWYRRPMDLDTGRDQPRSMAVFISAGDKAYVEHTASFHNKLVKGSPMQAALDSISHEFSLRQRPPDKITEDFIKQHPSSWLSYLLLDEEVRHHAISPASSVALYAVLSPELKKYEYVQKLGANIDLYAPPSTAPQQSKDFTVNDTNGQPVTLSSFKGKYVLLDFWASWCGPCRAENPNLIKAYNAYKERNFTILSVSMDESKQAWLDAVKKDGLTWTQASDLKGMSGPVAGLYKLGAIPANFLIDPAGKIVAANLRGEELEKKLAEIIPSSATTQSRSFELNGRVNADTLLPGKIYLQYEDDGIAMRDSCVLTDNTYHFTGVMKDGAIKANLFWKQPADGKHFSGFAQFYMAPGNTHVIHQARFNTFDVPGSLVQEENKWLNTLSARHSDKYADSASAFIRQHPDSWISYVALENMTRMEKISQDTASALYDQFSPTLKSYDQPRKLGAIIRGMAAAKVGKMATEITENDADGHPISLSSFRGKYVLVKFWASWCHPCRAENKVLVPIYQKYKGKGFEVLGVSIDNAASRDAWLKAVKEDATSWTQVADLKGYTSPVPVQYGVVVVPTSFLIDPQGKIIAKNMVGEELDKKLQELLN